MPSLPKLILSACLYAAAQEQPKTSDPHEQERKAYDEIKSIPQKVRYSAPGPMPLWYGRSLADSLGALWT
jgi:hypothetical protein